MDTALARAIANAIPSAASPGWGIFMIGLLVTLLGTLWLGPRVLSAFQKAKYGNPENDRRAPVEPESKTECAAHSASIRRLEKELRDQRAETAAQRAEISATKEMLSRELMSLREFIEEKFRQDHLYAQQERLAQEERITAQITNLISLISGRK